MSTEFTKLFCRQSLVFEAMFSEDNGNDVKVFEKIKNMSDGAFEDFLRYFYFGTIRSEDNAMEFSEWQLYLASQL